MSIFRTVIYPVSLYMLAMVLLVLSFLGDDIQLAIFGWLMVNHATLVELENKLLKESK